MTDGTVGRVEDPGARHPPQPVLPFFPRNLSKSYTIIMGPTKAREEGMKGHLEVHLDGLYGLQEEDHFVRCASKRYKHVEHLLMSVGSGRQLRRLRLRRGSQWHLK